MRFWRVSFTKPPFKVTNLQFGRYNLPRLIYPARFRPLENVAFLQGLKQHICNKSVVSLSKWNHFQVNWKGVIFSFHVNFPGFTCTYTYKHFLEYIYTQKICKFKRYCYMSWICLAKTVGQKASINFFKSSKVDNHLKQIQEKHVYAMNKSYIYIYTHTNWWFLTHQKNICQIGSWIISPGIVAKIQKLFETIT